MRVRSGESQKTGASRLGRELLDVLLDTSDVEADDGGELLDAAAVALAEDDVRDGADAELAGELLAVVNVHLDEQDIRVLGRELRELADKPLARAAPRGEEVNNNKTAVVADPRREIVVGVGAHEEKVAWMV